jgi:hypothetical protein
MERPRWWTVFATDFRSCVRPAEAGSFAAGGTLDSGALGNGGGTPDPGAVGAVGTGGGRLDPGAVGTGGPGV